VIVTPTDSTGAVFDQQTYTFSDAPLITYLDSQPAALTSSTSAQFTFHASDPDATFACSLDSAAAKPCVSPASYTGLADGAHTFTVTASANGRSDANPPHANWTVDTAAPTQPAGLAGTAPGAVEVDLSWQASHDTTGVTGYKIYRDGSAYQTIGNLTTFADTVAATSTHSYAVSALDGAGNESPRSDPVSVTTPAATAVFSDGFESGNLHAWSSSGGLTVQTATVRTGHYAALSAPGNVANYAKRTLATSYADGYARTGFDVVSQSGQINLLRLRTADGTSIGYAYVSSSGFLAFHNDATGTNTVSTTAVGPGWHVVEVHVKSSSSAGAADGTVQVWLDGALLSALSSQTVNVGAAPIAALQIGDVQAGKANGTAFDDAAFGTGRLGTV
jgi:hypothetical protein